MFVCFIWVNQDFVFTSIRLFEKPLLTLHKDVLSACTPRTRNFVAKNVGGWR